MPLGMAKVGEEGMIQCVKGRDSVRQHLVELGFVQGERVRVISEWGGSMILCVKGSRVALDRALAMRILL